MTNRQHLSRRKWHQILIISLKCEASTPFYPRVGICISSGVVVK